MRKLVVLLLLVPGCLAVGAWWTAQPRTAEQAMGWCVEQRGQEVTFVRCAPRPLPGSSSYGKVVGVSPQYIDFMGEPPFGHHCHRRPTRWCAPRFRQGTHRGSAWTRSPDSGT